MSQCGGTTVVSCDALSFHWFYIQLFFSPHRIGSKNCA